MTALRFVPGQIVALGTSPQTESFHRSYLSGVGELVASERYALPDPDWWLELFRVGGGEELRFLDLMRTQPGVIAASLNYIGFGLDAGTTAAEFPPESAYACGRTPRQDTQYLLRREDVDEVIGPFDAYNDLLEELKKAPPDYLIAAIDVCPVHCGKVMRMIGKGFFSAVTNREPAGSARARVAIVGMTAHHDQSTITDLFGFSGRLARLAELANPRIWMSC